MCWCVLFVVFVYVWFTCLRALCAMYRVMLYGLCFVAGFVCVGVLFICLCDVLMISDVLLSGFVLCCCAFARVGLMRVVCV